MPNCPTCKAPSAEIFPTAHRSLTINCTECGPYEVTEEARLLLTPLQPEQRASLSNWIYRQGKFGQRPLVKQTDVVAACDRPRPDILERAIGLLEQVCAKSPDLGQFVALNGSGLYAASATPLGQQGVLNGLAEFLGHRGWLKKTNPGGPLAASAEGWIELDRRRNDRGSGMQAFVAMWFSTELRPVFDGPIAVGIGRAGWRPFRVDDAEYNEKIDDRIIAEIRKSRFVVADLTATADVGQRGSVYFEAGYALGHGIPVVWTCRADAIGRIQFDARQYNFIEWDERRFDEFAERLKNRIEATIGRGPLKTDDG